MTYHFDWSVIPGNLGTFASGLELTVVVALITVVTSTALGLIVALLRLSPRRPVRYAAVAYIEFFRTIPFIVQLFWVFYAIPNILGIALPSFAAGIGALTVDVAAFSAETFRAGFLSLGRGQEDAAMALGLPRTATVTHILLPQVVRRVLPPLGTQWILLFQDTSLLALIQLHELTFQTLLLQAATFRTIEVFAFAALLYVAIAYPAAKLVEWLHRRYPTTAGIVGVG